MAGISAVQARLFRNVFVCKNCSAKIRADPRKIIERKVKCRKCKSRAFRPKKKSKR